MDLARWADDLTDFVRDFVRDFVTDTQQDIDNEVTRPSQTEDEWWELFLDYREATGS